MGRTPAPPPRLFVLLAPGAPVGVVIRKGPTHWVQLIRWDTRRDSFDHGQWFRGKIDPTRCDLSPSGDKLVYFAVSYKQRSLDRGYTGTWTAVSHPPYFTALALWPLGDTWSGGGLFTSETTLKLNHHAVGAECHPKHPASNLNVAHDPMAFWERSVLSERMLRDGWLLQSRTRTVYRGRKIAGTYPQKWERPDPSQRRSLLLQDMNDGLVNRCPCHYAVIYRKTDEVILEFEAEWADWDFDGKLAYAAAGKLWRVDFAPRGRRVDSREIADFNASRPDPQPAPEWATKW
jgi:hypothetical protein